MHGNIATVIAVHIARNFPPEPEMPTLRPSFGSAGAEAPPGRNISTKVKSVWCGGCGRSVRPTPALIAISRTQSPRMSSILNHLTTRSKRPYQRTPQMLLASVRTQSPMMIQHFDWVSSWPVGEKLSACLAAADVNMAMDMHCANA